MQTKPPFQAFLVIRWAAAALLAVAAVAAFSSSGQAAVFGTDDRKPLDERLSALKGKIGTLSVRNAGALCTAFCVAPNMIATASHCLFGTAANAGPRLRELRFKLANSTAADGVSEIAGSATASQDQHVLSGTQHLAVTPPIGAADDWAVAELEQPICTSGAMRITARPRASIEAAAARGELYQVAIHADLPGGALRIGGPCALHKDFPKADRTTLARDFMTPEAVLFHTCDTGGGSSGSPLLINTPLGPEVVAMNVGTYVLAGALPSSRSGSEPAPATPSSEAISNTAIAVTAIGEAVAAFRDGDTLTSAADIQRAQTLLRDAGFYSGAVTGTISDTTRAAVHRFNALYGRQASSRLTPALIADLETWIGSQRSGITTFAPANLAAPARNN